MIVWHVCSSKQLRQYEKAGCILPPVSAWETIEHAQWMSINTGRRVILRLCFPDNAEKLDGHYNSARVLNTALPFSGF